MDELFGPVVPDQDDELQQSAVSVESEAELPTRVFVVERDRQCRPGSSIEAIFLDDSVFER